MCDLSYVMCMCVSMCVCCNLISLRSLLRSPTIVGLETPTAGYMTGGAADTHTHRYRYRSPSAFLFVCQTVTHSTQRRSSASNLQNERDNPGLFLHHDCRGATSRPTTSVSQSVTGWTNSIFKGTQQIKNIKRQKTSCRLGPALRGEFGRWIGPGRRARSGIHTM